MSFLTSVIRGNMCKYAGFEQAPSVNFLSFVPVISWPEYIPTANVSEVINWEALLVEAKLKPLPIY